MTTVDRAVVAGGRAGLSATACVRVRDLVGDVVGSGFLVGPGLVATCAHVVAEALRTSMSDPQPPVDELTLDFPVSDGRDSRRTARVVRWVPVADDGRGDVALLRLDTPEPVGVVMPPVRGATALWDHPFRVFGFPEGQDDGVWSTGRVRGTQGTGWFQLQGHPGDHPIVGGFSGSPVWDDTTGAVIGMTVAADRDPDVTTAYVLPIADVLGLDPELLPCPYRGLEPFGEEHTDVFFGRGPELQRLREALRDGPLVAVAGPSGSGKSSLVNAGLVPALRAEGVPVAIVRPDPPETAPSVLAGAVLALADPGAEPERRDRDARRIGELLARPADRAAGVDELAAALGRAGRVVLVLDQFEELVEAALEPARVLLEILAALASAPGAQAMHTVLTIRSRALDDVLTPELARVLGSGTVLVGPLDATRLREVVVRPAERAPGLAFSDGLADRIVAEAAADPGQLPLVQSLLARLWHRRTGGTLTVADYEAAGGVAGALAAGADHAVATTVIGEPAERALDDLLTRLVALGRGGRPTRRSVRYLDLPDPARALVAPLAAHRLLVLTGQGEASTVELAHQSLAEHWPRLRDRVAADRDFLTWRTELDAARQRWLAADRDDGALLRGSALTAATRWDDRRGELAPGETEFLDRSREHRRRGVRRRRIGAAVLAAAVLAAATLTVVAVRGQARNDEQQDAANATTLARAAAERAPTDPVVASELALAAVRSDPANDAARSALAGQYASMSGVTGVLATSPGQASLGVVATGSGESAVLVEVTTATGAVEGSAGISVHRRPLSGDGVRRDLPAGLYATARPSPDGRWVALPRKDDSGIDLLDLDAPADRAPQVLVPASPGARAGGDAFSPDGSRLGWLTRDAGGRGTAFERDMRTGRTRILPLAIPPTETSVKLLDDPDKILLGSGPGRPVVLRSLSTGTDLRAFGPDRELRPGSPPVATGCTESRPGTSVVDATDVLTGATRTFPLLPGASCRRHWISTDGRYLLTDDVSQAGRRGWRAVELGTGNVFEFVTPLLDVLSWTGRSAGGIAVVPAPGGPVALVSAGSGVLRIPMVAELPAGLPATSNQDLTLDISTLLAIDGPDVTSADPAGRRVLARRDGLFSGTSRWLIDRDLWRIDQVAGGGWQLDALRAADLSPRVSMPLAGGPTQVGTAGTTAALVDGPDGEVAGAVGLVGGVLSAFDARTGEPLGKPVRLARTPADAAWYANNAVLEPREGHPGQVLVGTPRGPFQLWDVPQSRMLGELPVGGPSAGFTAAGDRLAGAFGRTLGVIDLRSGRPVVDDLPFPVTNQMVGFAPNGWLVALRFTSTTSIGQVTLYDIDRRAVAATFPLTNRTPVRIEGTRLLVQGTLGAKPEVLSLDPAAWRDQVCRSVPAQPSPAARALFPPGTDQEPLCAS